MRNMISSLMCVCVSFIFIFIPLHHVKSADNNGASGGAESNSGARPKDSASTHSYKSSNKWPPTICSECDSVDYSQGIDLLSKKALCNHCITLKVDAVSKQSVPCCVVTNKTDSVSSFSDGVKARAIYTSGQRVTIRCQKCVQPAKVEFIISPCVNAILLKENDKLIEISCRPRQLFYFHGKVQRFKEISLKDMSNQANILFKQQYSIDTLKSVFRKLSLHCHPDKNTDNKEDSTACFKKIKKFMEDRKKEIENGSACAHNQPPSGESYNQKNEYNYGEYASGYEKEFASDYGSENWYSYAGGNEYGYGSESSYGFDHFFTTSKERDDLLFTRFNGSSGKEECHLPNNYVGKGFFCNDHTNQNQTDENKCASDNENKQTYENQNKQTDENKQHTKKHTKFVNVRVEPIDRLINLKLLVPDMPGHYQENNGITITSEDDMPIYVIKSDTYNRLFFYKIGASENYCEYVINPDKEKIIFGYKLIGRNLLNDDVIVHQFKLRTISSYMDEFSKCYSRCTSRAQLNQMLQTLYDKYDSDNNVDINAIDVTRIATNMHEDYYKQLK